MHWRFGILFAIGTGLAAGLTGCEVISDRDLVTTELRPVTLPSALRGGESRAEVAHILTRAGFTPTVSDPRLTPEQAQATAGADIFTRNRASFPCAFDTDLFAFFDASERLTRMEGIRHEAGCT